MSRVGIAVYHLKVPYSGKTKFTVMLLSHLGIPFKLSSFSIHKTWSLFVVSVKQLNAFMGRVRAASRDAAKEVESALSATINVNEKTPAASKSIQSSQISRM